MSIKKSAKPDFYRTFMTEGFFPNANKITKYQESENYWIFKTGKKVFKVKKEIETSKAVPLEEIFCQQIVTQIQSHSPGLQAEILGITESQGSHLIDWERNLPGNPTYFCISMNQMSDQGFLSSIISRSKLTESILEQISQHLFHFHQKTKVCESKDIGSPDIISAKLDDLFYQSKKYLDVTITKAAIDFTFRPLQKYLVDHRKLYLRRMKKGSIRGVHGCFIPRKIHSTKEGIQLLGRTSDPLKHRFNDIATDLADLSVALNHADLPQFSNSFVESYVKLSGDKELKQVLPIYQALKSLDLGLKHSINANNLEGKKADAETQIAKKYYKQTIDVVRGL